MSTLLVLILGVAVAFLAAHVAFEWLAERYQIVSGAEYLLLGLLLGPSATGVISAEIQAGLMPLLVLALGWVGLLVGVQFCVPEMAKLRRAEYTTAIGTAITTVIVATAGLTGFFVWAAGMSLDQALLPASVLGGLSATSTPAGAWVASMGGGVRDRAVRQIVLASAVGAVTATLVITVATTVTYPAALLGGRPTPTEWLVIMFAVGCVGGILFHLFLGHERAPDRIFIGLAGAIILVTGATAYMSLVPILPALLVGFILVNTSSDRDALRRVLQPTERPLYYVLLILAGVAWQPPLGGVILAIPLYLALRAFGKLVLSRLVAWWEGSSEALGPVWGRGLLGQGAVALALALAYLQTPWAVYPDLVFTAVVISVLATDLLSARMARGGLEQSPASPVGRRKRLKARLDEAAG